MHTHPSLLHVVASMLDGSPSAAPAATIPTAPHASPPPFLGLVQEGGGRDLALPLASPPRALGSCSAPGPLPGLDTTPLAGPRTSPARARHARAASPRPHACSTTEDVAWHAGVIGSSMCRLQTAQMVRPRVIRTISELQPDEPVVPDCDCLRQ